MIVVAKRMIRTLFAEAVVIAKRMIWTFFAEAVGILVFAEPVMRTPVAEMSHDDQFVAKTMF